MALKQKTVYFREEDLDKWAAIKNKAEWLHEHLNGNTHLKKNLFGVGQPVNSFDGLEDIVDDSTVTMPVPSKIFKTDFSGKNKVRVCEHYQEKGQCLVKGCKYGKGK